jgi:hypothetical protein
MKTEYMRHTSSRMFENDFLEACSRVHPVTPFAVYIPLVTGLFTRRFHAIIHGYHHTYPDDEQRLVMPLGARIPLAVVIGGGLWWMGRPAETVPYFRGIVLGYYDYLHWVPQAAHRVGQGAARPPHGPPLRLPGQELRHQPPVGGPAAGLAAGARTGRRPRAGRRAGGRLRRGGVREARSTSTCVEVDCPAPFHFYTCRSGWGPLDSGRHGQARA